MLLVYVPLVPTPATALTTTPLDPVSGEPLLINCSSSVPESLQGQVRATLIGSDGSTLAMGTGSSLASATISIAIATDANSGDYECLVSITSPFLTSEGSPRPLQDSVVLFINISGKSQLVLSTPFMSLYVYTLQHRQIPQQLLHQLILHQ